ncbi:hypothetical protein M9H77_09988 [Catharanthus roseus]|uniref:Uncharacterized protein n=1 Tax=Catharanthus roseus TaxID=4058 RepID=A0ACC0C2M9_CATRO|nr:hypothetical protein M9H77_09988 [Catharanthus roseus]
MGWKKLNLLGKGSYGSVYSAGEATGSLIAVKSCDVSLSSSLQFEEKLLQLLSDCPFVINGIGSDISMEEGTCVYNLLLEYASGGSLDNLIKKSHNNNNGGKNKMSESEIASYAFMLLMGLSSIHNKGIVHCDFKPANILVIPTRNRMNLLKIADFGLSKIAGDMGSNGKSRCTPLYASPESYLWGLNEKPGDIWALGCIIVEMITGMPLWSSKNYADLVGQIAYRKPVLPGNLSKEVQDFLTRCLERDYRKRWTADMLLNHPFILKNLNNLSIDEIKSLHQELVTSKKRNIMEKPWIYLKGMFSTCTNSTTPVPAAAVVEKAAVAEKVGGEADDVVNNQKKLFTFLPHNLLAGAN